MSDDGGPAFPVTEGPSLSGWYGMTLRDWFAGQALAGLIANECLATTPEGIMGDARRVYSMADAMLAARKEPKA